jgi:hypothetical protein
MVNYKMLCCTEIAKRAMMEVDAEQEREERQETGNA